MWVILLFLRNYYADRFCLPYLLTKSGECWDFPCLNHYSTLRHCVKAGYLESWVLCYFAFTDMKSPEWDSSEGNSCAWMFHFWKLLSISVFSLWFCSIAAHRGKAPQPLLFLSVEEVAPFSGLGRSGESATQPRVHVLFKNHINFSAVT